MFCDLDNFVAWAMGKIAAQYSANDWVSTKIGIEPAKGSDRDANVGMDDEDEDELEGSNKSLCVSLCVLAFSIPALIGA